MNARLKFYGPLIVTNLLSLTYLLFFFYYNWLISDYPTIYEAATAIISHNPRWMTWGVCTGGIGLILGLMLTIGLLIALSNRDPEIFPDLTDKTLGVFPGFRGLSLFVAFVAIVMFIVNENWNIALKDTIEVLSIIVALPLFLITTLILIPTLLADILMTLLKKG